VVELFTPPNGVVFAVSPLTKDYLDFPAPVSEIGTPPPPKDKPVAAPRLKPVEPDPAAGATASDGPTKVKPDAPILAPELDAGGTLLLKAKPGEAAPPPTADDPPKVKPFLPITELEEAVSPAGA
jgi:hypothetical protein